MSKYPTLFGYHPNVNGSDIVNALSKSHFPTSLFLSISSARNKCMFLDFQDIYVLDLRKGMVAYLVAWIYIRLDSVNRRWHVCCTKHVQHTVSNVYRLLYVCMCGQWVVLCTNPRLQLLYYHWENKQDMIEKCSATHDNLVWISPSDYSELVI